MVFLLQPVGLLANDPSDPPKGKSETDLRTFIIERMPVAGGAELITVFGKFSGDIGDTGDTRGGAEDKVPLLSVLRDTLGDEIRENDRLRYVWVFTYARPDLKKNAASAVPFLYGNIGTNTGNNFRNNFRNNLGNQGSASVPPPLLDLSSTKHNSWQAIVRKLIVKLFLDTQGGYVRATAQTFQRNRDDYRNVHRMRALAILSLLDDEVGEAQNEGHSRRVFSELESHEVQGRLMLAEKSLGGFIDDRFLETVYQKQTTKMADYRGHNWELLRQRVEAEGLYFEPIEMPDGSATHALVWVAKPDLVSGKRAYDQRFLNIANPWNDKRLRDWKGISQIRYLDADNRLLAPALKEGRKENPTEGAGETPPGGPRENAGETGTAGGRAVEMIPLALYGLDHPRIPILLIDFRDGFNPKKREASRRVIHDVARNIFEVSRYGDLRFFLARAAFNFITNRRGMDLNQPSRVRAYSQLKLLLTIDDSLAPELKGEVNDRLERLSLNPLGNDLEAERKLAAAQYAALMEFARRPDGLPAKLNRDRGAELSDLNNSKWKKTFFGIGNILTWGAYEHREKVTDQRLRQLSTERQVAYHKSLLREAIAAGQPIEVAWNIETVRQSLRYITENSSLADSQTVLLAEQIFLQTADVETRELSLLCFYRINEESAKAALLRIFKDETLDPKWRTESALYLRKALTEQQRIAPAVAREIAGAGL